MSKRVPGILLGDIEAAINKINRYIAGLDEPAFLRDEKTIDAVIRNLEIIGDAARQLPDSFKQQHKTIPWAQITGLRNRIVHDYAGVDLPLVWNIVRNALPELLVQIRALR
jgi:uncharacterized protein with HEPN domain